MSDRNPFGGPLSSVASLTDMLTSSKNIVVALNNAAQNANNVAGNTNKAAISVSSLVLDKPGRLVNVIVTTAGSSAGTVHDVAAAGNAGATNTIYSIPNTVGVYNVNCPVLYGIVVVPGTGQVVTVTYS